MTILLNLHGAMHQLRNSTTNKEAIETINRLTEELYRTVAILFFTRYIARVRSSGGSIDRNLHDLVAQVMKEPTFDSWMRFAEMSVTLLLGTSDRFALKYIECSKEKLSPDLNSAAKDLLSAIQQFRSIDKYRPSKQVTPHELLSFILHLRNYRSHAWDSEASLQGLMDASIKELVPALIENLLRFAEVQILVPRSASGEGVRTVITDGLNTETTTLKDCRTAGLVFDACYVQYYADEDPFLFRTDLIRFDSSNNLCFVYQQFRERKDAIGEALFEAVPKQGNPKTHKVPLEDHVPLFRMPRVSGERGGEDAKTCEAVEQPTPGISLEEMLPVAEQSRPIEELIYRFFAQLRKGSTGIVAGMQLTDVQTKIYTESAMDRNFWRMLEEENPDLVMIAGNAGDGKTALMRMLQKEHGDTVAGRRIRWNFDATHSDSASENQVDTLRRYLSAFFDENATREPDDVHIIAMNTGMALSFFDRAKKREIDGEPAIRFSLLEETIRSMMDIPGAPQKPATRWKVLVLDLGRRALFNIDQNGSQTSSLISDLVSTLTGLDYWDHCQSCPAYEKCFIIANISLLRKESVVRCLEYLLLRASYSSNIHFTIRDFWEFISEAVGGRSSLHEKLSYVLTEKTCVSLVQYLADWPLYGDLLASLVYNSPFQDGPFFDESSKDLLEKMSKILSDSDQVFEHVDAYSELTNEFARVRNIAEASRIVRALLSHDPAGLSGHRIDSYCELAASKLLGPNPEEALTMVSDLLPQERYYLSRQLRMLSVLQEQSARPELRTDEADLIPVMTRELTKTMISCMKRRYVFANKEVIPKASDYDELYSRDYVTRFVQKVVLKARKYVFDGSRNNDPRRRDLISHILIDLLPDAVMTSEGLNSREALGLKRMEFHVSLDARFNRGELADYIAATPVFIDGSESDIHLGRAFDKHAGCMATVERYGLFDPVPMEVHVHLVVEGGRSADFKIDAATYGLLSGVLEGRQPSIVEDARYRNFEVIKKKIRELAKDRSMMAYYDLYGKEVLKIEPDTMDPKSKWKIEGKGS